MFGLWMQQRTCFQKLATQPTLGTPNLRQLTVSMGSKRSTGSLEATKDLEPKRMSDLAKFLAQREDRCQMGLERLIVHRRSGSIDFPHELFEDLDIGELRVMIDQGQATGYEPNAKESRKQIREKSEVQIYTSIYKCPLVVVDTVALLSAEAGGETHFGQHQRQITAFRFSLCSDDKGGVQFRVNKKLVQQEGIRGVLEVEHNVRCVKQTERMAMEILQKPGVLYGMVLKRKRGDSEWVEVTNLSTAKALTSNIALPQAHEPARQAPIKVPATPPGKKPRTAASFTFLGHAGQPDNTSPTLPSLKEDCKASGSTGSVYSDSINNLARCSFPDSQKGSHCKHIVNMDTDSRLIPHLFVFTRFLHVSRDPGLWYQRNSSANDDPISELSSPPTSRPSSRMLLLSKAPTNPRMQAEYNKGLGKAVGPPVILHGAVTPNANQLGQGPSTSSRPRKRMPAEDDDCPFAIIPCMALGGHGFSAGYNFRTKDGRECGSPCSS
ncbi:hypothetical protein BKA70DRAFT_1410103 [Coprinopsis sp. MPI-PUGE-AT-0042]|nr:hypothetical protein BKA70DRAFT_1410103 [Coprinopsis sp. MPI-PUGE-AT-0042]